jgi:hypothetical protein
MLYNVEQLRLRELILVENWLVSQSRFPMAKARGQFENPSKMDRPSLEAAAMRVVETVAEDTSGYVIYICKI